MFLAFKLGSFVCVVLYNKIISSHPVATLLRTTGVHYILYNTQHNTLEFHCKDIQVLFFTLIPFPDIPNECFAQGEKVKGHLTL